MKYPSTITPDGPENDPDGEPSSGVMASAAATLQHIENLHSRAQKLEALRIEAEDQFLHRVGTAWRAGKLTRAELADIQDRYQQLALVGRSKRWDAAIPVGWGDLSYDARMGREHAPNGPEGTWIGSWPIANDDRLPRPRTPVLYVLFNSANEPIYVGSTGSLRARLKAHARDGKPFVAWQASRSASREEAYQVEDRALKERMPPMNKKRGR